MPENWTQRYLDILVHQGRRHRVSLDAVVGVDAIVWLERQGIRHEIVYNQEAAVAHFYFETDKDAFLFKLRWLGA